MSLCLIDLPTSPCELVGDIRAQGDRAMQESKFSHTRRENNARGRLNRKKRRRTNECFPCFHNNENTNSIRNPPEIRDRLAAVNAKKKPKEADRNG